MNNTLSFYATGDVGPKRKHPETMFSHVAPLLGRGDMVFGQMETVLSRRGSPVPHARLPMRADPACVQSIRRAGFNMMSIAGNHCLDWGEEALLDTRECLAAAGIGVCGGGRNIVEARKPAIFRSGNTSIAVLAYSSVLPQGYQADVTRPGCAPMRAHTLYGNGENIPPAGSATIDTFPHREDLAALTADIGSARQEADLVLVSMHWGIHFVPAEIADYQRDVAHAVIDAGAEMVIGHHPHILKGVEIYSGRPIFYSLGNFAIEQPFAFKENLEKEASFREIAALNPGWNTESRYKAPPDTRKTLIVNCRLSAAGISDLNLIPCYINDKAEPEILSREDARFGEVIDYLAGITTSQGLSSGLKVKDGKVRVEPA